jgi:hypothetical protein
MAKVIKEETPRKFSVVYEDDEHKSTWSYDHNITRNGPVSIEIQHKKEPMKTKRVKKAKKVQATQN